MLKVLGDKVLIRKPVLMEEMSAGGILIPEIRNEKPKKAEVVAVGAGTFDKDGNRVPLDVKVGDMIVITHYGGTEMKHEGISYLLLRAADIVAILKEVPQENG